MKKIGIVSEYFYPHLGGVTEHVYFYAKELVKRGYEVVVITGYKGENAEVELPQGLRIINLSRSLPIYANHSIGKVSIGWDLGKKIKKILAEEQFDILHIHSPLDPILPLLFLKYSNTINVGTFHTYFDSVIYFKLFKKIAQNYLNKLDGIITVSPSCIEALSKYFDFQCSVIPNGVQVDWFSSPSGKIEKYNDGRPNILFLGRLDPRNGLDALLESFPQVLKEVPEARLLIVGDGPLRPFYEKKAGSYLGNKTFFEGQINEKRPEYFATCDVFAIPVTKASFGITLLEAMAAEKPIVGMDNKGFRNLIQNGENGILVPQGDVHELANAMIRVLKDKELASRLASNGRKSVEKYSWAHVADQVLKFYDQVYQNKKGVSFAA